MQIGSGVYSASKLNENGRNSATINNRVPSSPLPLSRSTRPQKPSKRHVSWDNQSSNGHRSDDKADATDSIYNNNHNNELAPLVTPIIPVSTSLGEQSPSATLLHRRSHSFGSYGPSLASISSTDGDETLGSNNSDTGSITYDIYGEVVTEESAKINEEIYKKFVLSTPKDFDILSSASHESIANDTNIDASNISDSSFERHDISSNGQTRVHGSSDSIIPEKENINESRTQQEAQSEGTRDSSSHSLSKEENVYQETTLPSTESNLLPDDFALRPTLYGAPTHHYSDPTACSPNGNRIDGFQSMSTNLSESVNESLENDSKNSMTDKPFDTHEVKSLVPRDSSQNTAKSIDSGGAMAGSTGSEEDIEISVDELNRNGRVLIASQENSEEMQRTTLIELSEKTMTTSDKSDASPDSSNGAVREEAVTLISETKIVGGMIDGTTPLPISSAAPQSLSAGIVDSKSPLLPAIPPATKSASRPSSLRVDIPEGIAPSKYISFDSKEDIKTSPVYDLLVSPSVTKSFSSTPKPRIDKDVKLSISDNDMNFQIATLHIRKIFLKDLKSVKLFSDVGMAMNPYVVVRIGNLTLQTNVVYGGGREVLWSDDSNDSPRKLDRMWEAPLAVKDLANTKLSVLVKDKNTFSDTLIGRGDTSLSELEDGIELQAEKILKLLLFDGENKYAGEAFVTVSLISALATLHIKKIIASELKPVKLLGGKNEPYAVVSIASKKWTRQTLPQRDNGARAEWSTDSISPSHKLDETWKVELTKEELAAGKLSILIKDKNNILSDVIIGEGELPLCSTAPPGHVCFRQRLHGACLCGVSNGDNITVNVAIKDLKTKKVTGQVSIIWAVVTNVPSNPLTRKKGTGFWNDDKSQRYVNSTSNISSQPSGESSEVESLRDVNGISGHVTDNMNLSNNDTVHNSSSSVNDHNANFSSGPIDRIFPPTVGLKSSESQYDKSGDAITESIDVSPSSSITSINKLPSQVEPGSNVDPVNNKFSDSAITLDSGTVSSATQSHTKYTVPANLNSSSGQRRRSFRNGSDEEEEEWNPSSHEDVTVPNKKDMIRSRPHSRMSSAGQNSVLEYVAKLEGETPPVKEMVQSVRLPSDELYLSSLVEVSPPNALLNLASEGNEACLKMMLAKAKQGGVSSLSTRGTLDADAEKYNLEELLEARDEVITYLIELYGSCLVIIIVRYMFRFLFLI